MRQSKVEPTDDPESINLKIPYSDKEAIFTS
jgi:hypothetical protein